MKASKKEYDWEQLINKSYSIQVILLILIRIDFIYLASHVLWSERKIIYCYNPQASPFPMTDSDVQVYYMYYYYYTGVSPTLG